MWTAHNDTHIHTHTYSGDMTQIHGNTHHRVGHLSKYIYTDIDLQFAIKYGMDNLKDQTQMPYKK